MKRTVLAAVMVAALVLGVVAYASALGSGDTVAVTATVNPQIQLTITGGPWDWLVTPGVAAADKTATITVKSNKLWDFTLDSTTYTPNDGLLDAVLSEGYAGDFAPGDTGVAKGVKAMTATYSLDMLGAGAFDLDPDQVGGYKADYLYTATQQ